MPDWTELRQKGGLDPLGMQASSVNLYQRLVPGISNVTLRIRYYGFYAWLSRTYAERIGSTDIETWKRTVRRSEALLALIAAQAGEENTHGGVAGVLWAARRLAEPGISSIDFTADSDPAGTGTPYLKQAWGAYGAAYATQVYEMGVFGEAKLHDVPVPTLGIGEALADGFVEATGESAGRFFDLAQAGRVGTDDIEGLKAILPSAIGADSAERSAYQQMLFATSDDPSPGDVARRRTLRLALHLTDALAAKPSTELLRWTCYAGKTPMDVSVTELGHELEDHRWRWWCYQAGDLGRISCEALLKWVLDTIEAHTAGIEPALAIAEAVEALDIAEAGWPGTWRQLVATLPLAANPHSRTERTSERRLAQLTLDSGRGAQRADVASARAAIELLAVLHQRCAPHRDLLGVQLTGEGVAFRSLASELSFLDAHQDMPLTETLARFLRDRVLERHLWVALQKLRHQGDYTFLVEADQGKLRVRAKDGPVLTNPRLDNALSFLRDVHLLDDSGLTDRGRNLVAAI
jgi:hypothetical protein